MIPWLPLATALACGGATVHSPRDAHPDCGTPKAEHWRYEGLQPLATAIEQERWVDALGTGRTLWDQLAAERIESSSRGANPRRALATSLSAPASPLRLSTLGLAFQDEIAMALVQAAILAGDAGAAEYWFTHVEAATESETATACRKALQALRTR